MSLPPSYDNYPRRVVRHTIQYSDPGPTHDSERVRSDDERLRKVEERLEREVRRDEYERRDRERMLAINERAKFHEQMDRLERDRVRTIMEDERIRQEREERIRRAQARSQRDQELLRREQEHAEDLIEKQRAEKLYEQNRKELELTEELYRTQRMEQDLERRKLSRKERRTNSGKTSSESRPAKVERVQSSGLSAPPPDEPKSFLSRFSGFLASAPAGKTEATPSKTEQAPKIDTSTKIDTVAKTVAKPDKSEPQLRSALTDLEGYFLQPAQDSLIQKSVVALSDSIDQHVYNHYGDRAASPSHDAFLRIVQLDAENLRLPQILTIKSSFRLAAIRRMIASALIRNISAKGDPSTTFMPKEVVSLLAMAPTRGTERCEFLAQCKSKTIVSMLMQYSPVWSILGVASNCCQFTATWAEHRELRVHGIQESASKDRIGSFA